MNYNSGRTRRIFIQSWLTIIGLVLILNIKPTVIHKVCAALAIVVHASLMIKQKE